MYDWSKMSVGILGAGIENISLTKFLLKNDAKVIVYDQSELNLIAEKLKDVESPNLMIVGGKDYDDVLSTHDIYFRSPGMPLEHAMDITDGRGKLSSAMELFFELCPAKIVGVTGTKGKGTTSSLIAEILKRNFQFSKSNFQNKSNVYLAGNIGKAPFDFIEELKPEDWVVIELSSFQLEDMQVSPHIAVVLNITPDHLAPLSANNPNYHKSFDAYVKAKRRIIDNQSENDYAVLALEDDLGNDFEKATRAKIFWVGNEFKAGSFIENDMIKFKIDDDLKEVVSLKEIHLPGQHNLINIQAAATAAYLAGAEVKTIAEGIKGFMGLPHRLQFIREINGIKYYDDSYATGPDAAIAAIKAFSQPVVLISGGSSKGAQFEEMAKVIKNSTVKAVVVVGEETEKIVRALEIEEADVEILKGLTTMKEMVGAATDFATPGDVVLLSPSCASFGLFASATDRGNQFQKIVNELT